MRKVTLLFALATFLSLFGFAPANAQATRTWVSGVGNDTDPCSRTQPCKTFAAAYAATAAGGEINCLDGGGFGSLTINKALTISCEAGTPGILVSGGVGAITIAAATTDVVTLRGLDFEGSGTATIGVSVTQAKEVHIEKCLFRNFRFDATSAAIATSGATTIYLFVVDSVISSNSNGIRLVSSGGFKVLSQKNTIITGSTLDGIVAVNSSAYTNITELVISGNGGSAVKVAASSSTANVDRTTMANNAVAALNAGASGATVRSIGNNIFDNGAAFAIASGGVVETDGQNRVGGNHLAGPPPNASATLQ